MLLKYSIDNLEDRDISRQDNDHNGTGVDWKDQIPRYEYFMIKRWCEEHGKKNPYTCPEYENGYYL